MSDTLVLTDADTLTLVDADTLKLADATTPSTTAGSGQHAPSPQTQAYWDREGRRLATTRDDEETLLVVI